MSYCGETDGKRIARAWLYDDMIGHCRDRLIAGYERLPEGLAVVLCGPTAADVKILINVLGWSPTNILAVDLTKENLSVASALGARTFYGDINDAIQTLNEPVAFLNLDLMGRLSAAASATVALARRLMSADSIVSVTFMRGRERRDEMDRISRWSEGITIKSAETGNDTGKFDRDVAMATLMYRALGQGDWRIMTAVQYQSTCPMSIVAFRRRAHSTLPPVEFRVVRPGASVRKYMLHILATGPGADRRALARSIGLDADDIWREHWTQLLNLPPATVVAWRAHATRGTYADSRP